jgi:hypothetical protein
LSTLDVSSVGKNCLSDEDFVLISHVDLLSEFKDDAVKRCSDEVNVEDCVASKPNVLPVRPFRTPETDELPSVHEGYSGTTAAASMAVVDVMPLHTVCSDEDGASVSSSLVVTEHSYANQKSCVANVSFDCHSDCREMFCTYAEHYSK